MEVERLIRDEEAIEDAEILVIADRSGSMHSIVEDAVGGFNSFLADQREIPGKAFLTLAIFDHEYQVVCESTPINEMKDITSKTIKPRGNTALLDAIGRGITDLKPRVKDARVIVVIITDGGENASTMFDTMDVKDLVTGCEKDGWQFLFLGANIDSFTVGSSMGMAKGSTVQYNSNARGINSAYANVSDTVSSFRSGSST